MEKIECMPKSVLNFYVMLYCRKRKMLGRKKQSVLREATKSWLSLSDNEKEIFTAKYNKIQAECKQNLANSLKNAKPYLKRKYSSGKTHEELNSNDNNFKNISDSTICNKIDENTDNNVMSNENTEDDQKIGMNTNDHELQNETLPMGQQPEPIPPTIKTGKELFQILTENEENCKTWESLTQSEKRVYGDAVLAIKKKYLKSYQLFLESLSPKELYNYYINKKEFE